MLPRAVTGLGVVSTVGIGREAFFRALAEPKRLSASTARPVESFDATAYPNAAVAEVLAFDPTKYLGDKGLRTLDRLTKILIVAARLGMHDAGFKKDGAFVQSAADRVGLCVSNAYGSLEAITELDRVAQLEDARYINPAKFPNTVSNSASGYVSIWEDLRALNVTVSDGNCGALDAVACGDVHLATGRADALLVGGGEAMSEALYMAFLRLGVPSECALLGEGAALMSFEPLDLATARGANVMAHIVGYGTAFQSPENDASLIHASRDAMADAVTMALADAKVRPEDIDVVATGASGLRAFDEAELEGVTRVLGKDVALVAPKFVLGETLGAGGAMAMAATLAWFQGAPPFPILQGSLREGRATKTALVTTIGFYGNASAIVITKP